MADPGIYAISIRKTTPWRGFTQGFSNLYHYDMPTPSEAELLAMIDALKTAETPVHSSGVSFFEARAWGPVNPDGRGGRMEAVKTLSGTGSAASQTGWYREFAYLVKWPLGRYGSKNRPQFLRKWIHSMVLLQGAAAATDGTTDLGGITTPLSTYAAAVRTLTGTGITGPKELTSASGHVPIGAAQLFKYLEHHQFGR